MTEVALFGTDLFGDVIKPKASGPVAERFTLPPFTLLDGRSGEWQERKRAWNAMGIRRQLSAMCCFQSHDQRGQSNEAAPLHALAAAAPAQP